MKVTLWLPKSSWTKGHSPYRKPTVRFPLNIKDQHKVLDNLAKNWGDINTKSTVFKNDALLLKWYSCSGHGGYLLYSKVKLDIPWEPYFGTQKDYTNWPSNLDNVYVYSFEEDCDWSLLYAFFHSNPKGMWTAIVKEHNSCFKHLPSPPNLVTWSLSTIEKYYPEHLKRIIK